MSGAPEDDEVGSWASNDVLEKMWHIGRANLLFGNNSRERKRASKPTNGNRALAAVAEVQIVQR